MLKFNLQLTTYCLLKRILFLVYCTIATFPVLSQISYTPQSVLSSGNFYKFSVQQTGVCKINKAFLEEMGINTNNALLNQLRIYGNSGGMLPENAGTARPDDLLENSLEVVDINNNNVMDGDDYVLFYAQAPHQWKFNDDTQKYVFEHHLYSNKNYYFLTFDKGEGKRIATTNNNSNFDFETSAYDALRFYEEEKENPLQSGRVWLGETMVPGSKKEIAFSFQNPLNNSQIAVQAACVGSYGENSSQFSIAVNGVSMQMLTFPGTNFLIPEDEAPYGEKKLANFTFPATQAVNLSFQYSANSSAPRGHIDYAFLTAKCALNLNENVLQNGVLIFTDSQTRNQGTVKYNLSNIAPNLRIWEIEGNGVVSQKQIENNSFTSSKTNGLQKFIAFNQTDFVSATFEKQIANQNLHALNFPDFIIVTHPNFIDAAYDLANFHQTEDNMNVLIADIEQVYNEFSSGTPDISAIRNFVKMFYDRAKATGNNADLPENLLLMGDASFDYKNIATEADDNSNFVPTYESPESLLRVESYCSDDYYTFLDDNEGGSITGDVGKMDIGVGRFPVKTAQEAKDMVNKVRHYKRNTSKGAWLNNLTFISDDGNGNLHFNQAELHTTNMSNLAPVYNIDKIHSDAYPQVSSSGGSTYPAASSAISNKVFTGSFLMNYSGHGGENGWADEQILTSDIVRSWKNIDKLPLFVTATCSFTRYDRPSGVSAGEWLVLNPQGGAIALMTTVRLVYSSQNLELNRKFLDAAFDFSDGVKTIGEIARKTKNNISNSSNSRKFVLMGDPALTLNYPTLKVATTEIINQSQQTATLPNDTLRAMQQITIKGKITDAEGNFIPNFNGIISPVVYDKVETLSTLGNDSPDGWDGEGNCPGIGEKETSCAWDFNLQRSIIFKGNASVENGIFEFSFIVPKDIAYNFGKGKISYFALENDGSMAHGYDNSITIGGIADTAPNDDKGPKVSVFLNDESFVYGGLVNENPLLLVQLQDDNGINTVGRGIGHDLTALLNDDQQNILVLNNYYESALNNFRQGTASYPLEKLEEGRYSVRVKAWDILNNSGEGYTEFLVAQSEQFALNHVLNYPNPFSDNTAFWFEHNRTGDFLDIRVQIFSISGRLVKTLTTQVAAANTRVTELNWDGLDDFGNKLARGTYVYQLMVKTSDGQQAHKIEKLVILK